MKFAVIQFPGSNCDQDCLAALKGLEGAQASYVWHKTTSLNGYDAIVIPGGFSYGDYLRCGAIARFSPIMKAVVEKAHAGMLVIGVCNGFQILCEAGLLPGALLHNVHHQFICKNTFIRAENNDTLLTASIPKGKPLKIPIAHGEGNFYADDTTMKKLNENGQILFRYCDESGAINPQANPNGTTDFIAGNCNEAKNVFGMMPHPERAADPVLGNTDGKIILESFYSMVKA